MLQGVIPNFVYLPDADFNGIDDLQFKASDGTEESGDVAITFDVQPINDPPTADAQSVTVDEDTSASITLTGADIDSTTLTFDIDRLPAKGSISGAAPDLVYTPALDANGTDSFTFVASDGDLDSAPQTILIGITPVNDPPSADAQSVRLDEDQSATITLTGSDVDLEGLTFSVSSQPANGSLTGAPPNLTYTPDADFNGSDAFRIIASDASTSSAEAEVTLSIEPVNDPPFTMDVSLSALPETRTPLTLTAQDVDGDDFTFSVSSPTNGAVTAEGGGFFYTSAPGFIGADSFTFTASDGSLSSEPATITVDVTDTPNQPPTFVAPTPDEGATLEGDVGEALEFQIAATDLDASPQELTVTLRDAPAGSDFDGADGTFSWTPTPDDVGAYTVVAVATDGEASVERAIELVVSDPDSGGEDAGSNGELDAGGSADVGDGGDPSSSGGSSDEGCCASAPGTPRRAPLFGLFGLLGLLGLRRRARGPRWPLSGSSM